MTFSADPNYHILSPLASDSIIKIDDPSQRSLIFINEQKEIFIPERNKITIIDSNHKVKIYETQILNRAVIGIRQINDYEYYVATSDELYEFNFANNTLKISKLQVPFKTGEQINFIRYSSSRDSLFVLSSESIYILKDKEVMPVTNLPKADYKIIQEIKEGYYFVGTYGNGYFLVNGQQWTKMPLDKNKHLLFSHTVLLDNKNHLWISTNSGLLRTDFNELVEYTKDNTKPIYYYRYDKTLGFSTNEFNGGCQSPAIRLKNGSFSFSSMDGLVHFNPELVPVIFPQSQLYIIQVWLNEEKTNSPIERLELNQDTKEIKIEIGTAYFGKHENLQIEYKLEPHNPKWQRVTNQNQIIIQNLLHGEYRLHIRKRIGFGINEFDYLSIPITVNPYFYQTTWFYFILTLMLLISALIFKKFYQNYLVQQNKNLEALVIEKSKGLHKVNEILSEKIKQNDLFQSILVHDIKSPLRFIHSNSKILIDHWIKINEDSKKENIALIMESSFKIQKFIDETLLWMQIRNKELTVQNINFQAIDIIENIVHLYSEDPKIISKQIVIQTDCNEKLILQSDPHLISTILRNLLMNSIKYSTSGIICLYIKTGANGKHRIGCKDQGKGMDKTLVNTLLQQEYTGNTIRKDSYRLGFIIIKEITELLGAQLYIEANEPQGTNVYLEL